MAKYWNKNGIPHGGWELVRTVEHEWATETCEMCDQKNIRYIDIVSHPDYLHELNVGRCCGDLMTNIPNGSLRYPVSEKLIILIPTEGKWRVMIKNGKLKERFDSRTEAGMWVSDNLNYLINLC